MRNLRELERYRRRGKALPPHWQGNDGGEFAGIFSVPFHGRDLFVIATADPEWDHVSVSKARKCPPWTEMCHIKNLFFLESETAMQLHVSASDHVNDHPFCLHLWRPTAPGVTIPRPPSFLVGGMSPGEAIREAERIGYGGTLAKPR